MTGNSTSEILQSLTEVIRIAAREKIGNRQAWINAYNAAYRARRRVLARHNSGKHVCDEKIIKAALAAASAASKGSPKGVVNACKKI